MKRRAFAIASLIALTGCGGCGDDDDAAPAAPEGPPLSPWTFGAARTRESLVLPPPCVEREPTLKAVLSRSTRIRSQRHTLGQLWVAEGPSGGNDWRAEASAIVRLTHGRTTSTAVPWPETSPPLVALRRGVWQLVFDKGGRIGSWHDGVAESWSLPGSAVDYDCAKGTCALLTSDPRPVLRIGPDDQPPSAWQRIEVGKREHVPLSVRVAADHATVVTRDNMRVRFSRVHDGNAEETTILGATPALMTTMADPVAAVVTEPPYQLANGCATEGGVTVKLDGLEPVRLRSAEPPITAKLTPLSKGVLVTWVAPLRCRSRRHVLYAAVVGSDGTIIAPVTTVGETDAIHTASTPGGDDVDLWLHSEQDNTITWVRARCR